MKWNRKYPFQGSISVCPNIMGLTYSIQDLSGYSYEWTVSGGTIASGQGTSAIVVNWGDTNAAANVAVRVTSSVTCEVSADLAVIINEQLEPPLPIGPAVVCFSDQTTLQTYNTPLTPGSDYQWQITGGTIQSGQDERMR